MWVTKNGQQQEIEDGTLPYWRSLGWIEWLPDANAAYVAAFPVPAPTGVAATDQAAITAVHTQAAAAVAAGASAARVILGAGTYKLNASLPVAAGVRWEGSPVVISQSNNSAGVWMADGDWNYSGGTILQGDGTFACFAGNTVAAGSPDPTGFGATQISGWGAKNLAFDNFTYAIQVGATNVMGLTYGELDGLYAKNCSQWAFYLANFAHCTIGGLYVTQSKNGMYFASLLPGATFAPTNSHFTKELFVKKMDNGGAYPPRFSRGIVFDAVGTAAGFGQAVVNRVQVNGYNNAEYSTTATFTNTSSNVAVADGTQFAVGMTVSFATSAAGFTAGNAYYVQAVSGNNLTLGTGRLTAAITANASTTATIKTRGYPHVEVTAGTSGAHVNACDFRWIDVEGDATNGLWVEAATGCKFHVTAIPTNASGPHIVGRSAQFSEFRCTQAADTDFDAGTTPFWYSGQRSANIYGFSGMGMWRNNGQNVLGISDISSTFNGNLTTRIQGMLYPKPDTGRYLNTFNSSTSVNAINCGNIVFNGASGQTITLPTIASDNTPSGSHVGLWFEIWNVSSANSVSIATNGTQTFNNVGALVTHTLAARTVLYLYACHDASGNYFWAAKESAVITT